MYYELYTVIAFVVFKSFFKINVQSVSSRKKNASPNRLKTVYRMMDYSRNYCT